MTERDILRQAHEGPNKDFEVALTLFDKNNRTVATRTLTPFWSDLRKRWLWQTTFVLTEYAELTSSQATWTQLSTRKTRTEGLKLWKQTITVNCSPRPDTFTVRITWKQLRATIWRWLRGKSLTVDKIPIGVLEGNGHDTVAFTYDLLQP